MRPEGMLNKCHSEDYSCTQRCQLGLETVGPFQVERDISKVLLLLFSMVDTAIRWGFNRYPRADLQNYVSGQTTRIYLAPISDQQGKGKVHSLTVREIK